MKAKLVSLFRWLLHRLPETLLGVLVVSLLPLVGMAASQAWAQIGVLRHSPAGYWEAVTHNPWPALSTLTCMAGTAVLVYVLVRSWAFVWAVARKMIIEALHRRIIVVLLVFFIVLMLSLPFMLKTEGSMESRVQLVITYSLVVAMVLLSLVAIFLSAASICGEVEQKQVQVTDTKPLRRWQFILGKWVGVVVLCTGVMAVMTAVSAALIAYLSRPPALNTMSSRDAAKAKQDYARLRESVLVARKALRPVEPAGTDDAVKEALEKARQAGELPAAARQVARIRDEMRQQYLQYLMTIGPGGHYTWQFEGLRPGDTKGTLQVQFRGHITTPGKELRGRWVVFQRSRVRGTDGKEQDKFTPLMLVYPPSQGWHRELRPEFSIPAKCVAPDGTLFLSYENLDQRGTVVFDAGQMTEVFQREGGFAANYYRSVVVLMCHVALLAALGLMAGSVFSLPVAGLTVTFFFIVGLIGPWFVSFLEPEPWVEYTPTQEVIAAIWRGGLRALLAVMPHFGQYNPLSKLTGGVMITWAFVAYAGAMMVYVKSSAALLVGMYLYGRRELARVIV